MTSVNDAYRNQLERITNPGVGYTFEELYHELHELNEGVDENTLSTALHSSTAFYRLPVHHSKGLIAKVWVRQ